MFDTRGLLRLILMTAYSNRQIATLLTVSPTTVSRYRQVIQAIDFTFERLNAATDSELNLLFRSGKQNYAKLQVQPDWPTVIMQIKKGFTRAEAHEAYAHEAGERPTISYRTFCRGYDQEVANLNPVMIQVHKPGGAMMTDFAGYQPQGCDEGGSPVSFELYVAVLPASNYTYACVVRSQKIADWLEANQRALRFFAGVPEAIISDNLKAAVQRPKGRARSAIINPAFQAFCEHYGAIADPTWARRPTHKAKVEIGVKLIQRLLRRNLQDRPLQRLEAINGILIDILNKLNAKPMRNAMGESRISLFRKLDRPELKPLRQESFPFFEVKRGLMLGPDYHLLHSGRRYSAPHILIGQKLDLRISVSSVEILHDSKAIAVHPRLTAANGISTDPSHMPPHHLARRAATEEDLVLWAQLHSEAVQTVARTEDVISLNGAAKSTRYNAFRELHKRVGSIRFEAACARAVRMGSPRLKTVRNILDRSLEFAEVSALVVPPTANATNENVRGANYFTGREQ